MATIDTLEVEIKIRVKVGLLSLMKLRLLGFIGYKKLMKDKIKETLLSEYMDVEVKGGV